MTRPQGKQTFAFFPQNLVSQYSYTESVADGVNVDFDIYRIKTEISESGATLEAGTHVPKVDRRTRKQRIEAIDETLEYKESQLDRAVTNINQIRLVLETFRDRLPEIFPGRATVPKTLIFCKDDDHAEEVVTQVRQVHGKGNDFAAKITYQAKDPKGRLQAFRTSPSLRVAVTVDMIATGTDVKPLECVLGDVHRVAEHCVVQPPRAAEGSCDHRSSVDSDPDLEGRKTLLRRLLIEGHLPTLHGGRAPQRPPRVIGCRTGQ